MSLLFKSEEMNPELCISLASARKTATPATAYHYVGLEHGRDCYAATAAPSPIPTSLIGATACTNTCLGNKAGGPFEMCGGWKQYDHYASVTGSVFSGPVPTSNHA
jgi:iron transport multicopper oxidase